MSGKTVYRGMGLEEVRIEVWRKEAETWVAAGEIRSGYHGSFALRVEPGEYSLRATADLGARARPERWLDGTYPVLEVPAGVRRIDRVRIEMGSTNGPVLPSREQP